jgi:ADP-heptose:LPS heptosyltransferase
MTFVFHQAALGDFVMIFPLLRALSPVHVVAPWEKASLAAKLIAGVTPHNIERRLDDVDRLSQATRVISFVSDGHDRWAESIRIAAPHAALLFDAPPFDELPIAPCSNPTGAVIIHPGSGGKHKCWPLERYESLAAMIDGARFIVGEVEADTWPRLPDGAHALTSLGELHDELKQARAYIGNDSGPTHLAAQMGLPTLALFGPTDPVKWSPRGPSVTVLAPEKPCEMTWLDVLMVLRASQSMQSPRQQHRRQ